MQTQLQGYGRAASVPSVRTFKGASFAPRLYNASSLALSARAPQVKPASSEWVVARHASTEDAGSATAAPTAEPAAPAATDGTPSGPSEEQETVLYEGPGSNAEFILSLILLPTLIYAPLSIASIGRRLWISFRFTNKRLTIVNTSPLFKRTIEVAYSNIKEIRTGPRAFGLWGDMVIFLRDGSRLELTGVEKYKEIAEYINRCIYTL